jgi:ABC-2 type transport system ATP-binding protein
MAHEAVRISGVRKAFGDQVVLDGIDLVVEQGSIHALLGPNGSGKTTLIRILSTLSLPDAGTATVDGHDVVTDPEGVRRSISLTGQFTAVDDLLTGAENLEMMSRLAGFGIRGARARAAELLAAFDLEAARDRRAATYSGGMRRRLDLAASLVTPPAVLFLDEPTTGLDARSRQALWAMIEELGAAGTTTLLTTQQLDEADHLADRIAVIDGGLIVAEGSSAQLKARVGVELVELVLADEGQLAAVADGLGAVEVDLRSRVVRLPTDGSAAHLRRLLDDLDADGVEVLHVATRRPSLDDVFLALTAPADHVRFTARTQTPEVRSA